MTKLSLATLKEVSATAAIPGYDRSSLVAGIVHFGVGNFHRAHQAVYLDDLFNLGHDHDWAIVGAGVLPSDSVMRDKLAEQDFLTTVVEQDNNSLREANGRPAHLRRPDGRDGDLTNPVWRN